MNKIRNNPSLRDDIEKDLRAGTPIPLIVEKYNLADSDEIYEITYSDEISADGHFSYPGFSSAQAAETGKCENNFTYPMFRSTLQFITSHLPEKSDGLRILEIGSGTGDTANRIHSEFGSFISEIVCIELSESGTNSARNRYGNNDALRFICGDAYLLESYEEYDVVYHINTLEHVPNPLQLLDVGINALKPGGYMVFSCPTIRWWQWFGWAKYIICKLTNTPFLFHGVSENSIKGYFRSKKAEIYSNHFYRPILPRRVFRYLTPRAIRLTSSLANFLEAYSTLRMDNWLQFWFIRKPASQSGPGPFSIDKKENLLLRLSLFPVTATLQIGLWLYSSVVLTVEVLRRKKPFFKQW